MRKKALSLILSIILVLPLMLSDGILPEAKAAVGSEKTINLGNGLQARLFLIDTYSYQQWNLNLTEGFYGLPTQFSGRGTRVAVLDTGINFYHEDFYGTRIETGYNYAFNNTDTWDYDGHGTMVSGIIAAQTDNSAGITGLIEETTIVPLKIFEGDYGEIGGIVQAIYDAVDVYKVDVINMSFGLDFDFPPFHSAIQYANRKGVILVASVGNDGTEARYFPASYPEVIGVGSVGIDPVTGAMQVSDFSQRSNVFVAAPGEDILSLDFELNNYYWKASGTSFSAPHVAAMAAKAKQAKSTLTPEAFKTLLQETSDDYGATGYDKEYGYGIINFRKMIYRLVTIQQEYANEPKPAEPALWVNPFTDVSATDWFYKSVSYVNQNKLFQGIHTDTFSPKSGMTRAMFVTVLGRMYEKNGAPIDPSTASASSYIDAVAGSWYFNYMNWASNRGIVQGVGENAFAPGKSVTREQIALFLYRYANTSGVDMSYEDTGAFDFMLDSGKTSAWAEEAMRWAVSGSLIRGNRNGVLNPQGVATRAEVAQIIIRFNAL